MRTLLLPIVLDTWEASKAALKRAIFFAGEDTTDCNGHSGLSVGCLNIGYKRPGNPVVRSMIALLARLLLSLLFPAKHGPQMPLGAGQFLLDGPFVVPEFLRDLGLRFVVTPTREENLAPPRGQRRKR